MDDELAADLAVRGGVLNRLEGRVRALVGDRATVERSDSTELIWAVDVTPTNSRARPIEIVAEHFLHVNVGEHGGQFELGYSAEDEAFAGQVVQSVVAGRVHEAYGFWETTVHVEFDDGPSASETAIGRRRRPGESKRRDDEPYG